MSDYWSTQVGRKFLEGTAPEIAYQLKEVAEQLKRVADVMEAQEKRDRIKSMQKQHRITSGTG